MIRTLQGHAGGVNAVALSSDGRRALSGSHDNTLKLWDTGTREILAEFSGEGPITAVDLSKDGRKMVAGDAFGRVHFLTLENPPL